MHSEFILQLLEQIEAKSSDTHIILPVHACGSENKTVFTILIENGLLTKRLATFIDCIGCNSKANVKRNQGGFFAVCGCCGITYEITKYDTIEYSTGLLSLAHWISKIAAFDEEPELIADNVFFLGNHQGFEIHLIRGSSWENAESLQKAIIQQKTNPVIALCLSSKPMPSHHKEIRMISVASCLSSDGEKILWNWPNRTFIHKDSVKQYAAKQRVANDPRQQCKENLKTFVIKNIHSLFYGLLHTEISQKIKDDFSDYLVYLDGNGNQKHLSWQLTLNAIKEALRKKGLSDRISGLKQTD